MNKNEVVFDIGMFDAADTQYYLDEGYRVIAVEANPALVRRANETLAEYVHSGRLTIVNAAVRHDHQDVVLQLSADDLGSSTTKPVATDATADAGRYTVRGLTPGDILALSPTPAKYLKIDIEGMDEMVVRALTTANRPEFLSFEIGDELSELIGHLEAIGYRRFKIIDQTSFRSIDRMSLLRDRMARAVVRLVGFAEPRYVRRNGRLFTIGHSSGPAPWCSDGPWHAGREVLRQWEQRATGGRNVWFDLHAR